MVKNKYGFILDRYAQPTHYNCIEGRYTAYYTSKDGKEYAVMCEVMPCGNPENQKVVGYSISRMEGIYRMVEKIVRSQKAVFDYLRKVGVDADKKTTFTILTNRTDGWENCYNDYLECCENNGVEPAGEGSSEYWDWVYEEVDNTIDCDLMNMEYSKIKDRLFVITGAVQLWDGRRTIKPVFMRGLVDVIKKIWGSGDRRFLIELDTKDGIITSRLWSHDDPMGGTRLEVHMLNKNGEKWLAAAEERGEADEIEINSRWVEKITDIGMIY